MPRAYVMCHLNFRRAFLDGTMFAKLGSLFKDAATFTSRSVLLLLMGYLLPRVLANN
jgi:hypothetical protein